MENKNILEEITLADMILVGIGEEFDNTKKLRTGREYMKGCESLKEAGLHWLIPAWNEFCAEKAGDCSVRESMEKLGRMLEDKNYYMVSLSAGSEIMRRFGDGGGSGPGESALSGTRLVMPCGSVLKKQCVQGCGEILSDVTEEDGEKLRTVFEKLYLGKPAKGTEVLTGICPECGSALVLNNVYAQKYNEKGYLAQWQRYMKWLQETLNRKLFILELGVGMRFPTVIRWPFEKAAFYNKRACFCRVNEKLYHLTEELAEKGWGIPQNAIDWLLKL